MIRTLRRRISLSTAALVLLSAALPREACSTVLKTDKGNGVLHWHWAIDALTHKNGNKFPGYISHDRAGKETQKAWRPTPEHTAAQKTKIDDGYKAKFPGLVVKDDPTVTFDCHSHTFLGGPPLVLGNDVGQILVDNGWKQLAAADKRQVGDIVLYKKNDQITHTATVSEVNAQGGITKLTSKWGTGGTYEHAYNQFPAEYGAPVFAYTGGKKLNPAAALTAEVVATHDETFVDPFQGILPPPLKDYLWNVDVNPDAGVYSEVPICPLINIGSHEVTDGVVQWDYALMTPDLTPVQVQSGDQLTLYGADLFSAQVSGLAAQTEFGAWVLESLTPQQAVFTATQTSSFLPSPFMLDGFSITSSIGLSGEMLYTEGVAGHIGLVAGPVPEPSTAALLCGLAGIFLWRPLRDRHRAN